MTTRGSTVARRVLAVTVGSTVALAVALGVAPARAQAPDGTDPAPTAVSVTAPGPHEVERMLMTGVPGFWGPGLIFAPTDATGPSGLVLVIPGLTAPAATMAGLGQELASHGFVVGIMESTGIADFPSARGEKASTVIDALLADPRLAGRVDRGRIGVVGWSMGGGGATHVARNRDDVDAVVAVAPGDFDWLWSDIDVPTQIVVGSADPIVNAALVQLYWSTLPQETPRAITRLQGRNHFFIMNPTGTESGVILSWLKRFVDDDARYAPFVCPGPDGSPPDLLDDLEAADPGPVATAEPKPVESAVEAWVGQARGALSSDVVAAMVTEPLGGQTSAPEDLTSAFQTYLSGLFTGTPPGETGRAPTFTGAAQGLLPGYEGDCG